MKVTIVAEESRVTVEGFTEPVDCSTLAEDISVIQWYGTFGEIEFHTDLSTGDRKPNERISDYAVIKPYVDLWEIEAQREIKLAA
jgi:hypothetical protein